MNDRKVEGSNLVDLKVYGSGVKAMPSLPRCFISLMNQSCFGKLKNIIKNNLSLINKSPKNIEGP